MGQRRLLGRCRPALDGSYRIVTIQRPPDDAAVDSPGKAESPRLERRRAAEALDDQDVALGVVLSSIVERIDHVETEGAFDGEAVRRGGTTSEEAGHEVQEAKLGSALVIQ
jgi:hypothetical protein